MDDTEDDDLTKLCFSA